MYQKRLHFDTFSVLKAFDMEANPALRQSI